MKPDHTPSLTVSVPRANYVYADWFKGMVIEALQYAEVRRALIEALELAHQERASEIAGRLKDGNNH